MDACVYKTVFVQTKTNGLPKVLASMSRGALAEIEITGGVCGFDLRSNWAAYPEVVLLVPNSVLPQLMQKTH